MQEAAFEVGLVSSFSGPAMTQDGHA